MYGRPVTDTTSPLWDNLYLVRVPRLQTMSVEYLKNFGTYITGDKAVDRALSEQWVTTMISIAKMIEYYQDGSMIKIVKQQDIEEIYQLISNHLNAWLHQLTNGLNIGNAPIKDLLAMDKFANEIYEHAKYIFTPTILQSAMEQGLTSVVGLTPVNFFKNVDLSSNSTTSEDGIIRINQGEQLPARESLSDYLKDHLSKMKRWS